MIIPIFFFIFLSFALLGLVGAIANMMRTTSGKSSFGGMMILHGVAAIFWVIGGLGSLITGIVWLVQYIKS